MTFGTHILNLCCAAQKQGTTVNLRWIADLIDKELPAFSVPQPPPAKPKEKERERDYVFEALAAVDGVDIPSLTKTQRGRLNEARKQICDVMLGWENQKLGQEVASRAARYRALHPTWPATSQAIVAHWGSLGTPEAKAAETVPEGWQRAFMEYAAANGLKGWTIDGSAILRNANGEPTAWRHIPKGIQRELLMTLDPDTDSPPF